VPPHRRRPAPSTGQAPPIRRPKVAGMRNRADHGPNVEPDETDDSTERVSGVLTGLRGTPPKREPDDAETTVLPRITDEPAEDRPEVEPETNEPPAITEDPEDSEDFEEAGEAEEPERKPRPAVAKGGVRPAGKRRSTGAARPEDLEEAESDAGHKRPARRTAAERPARTKPQTQLSVATVLVVVAVVLVVLAVFFRGKANDLTSGDTNTALTDSGTTSQVTSQLTNAIKQTFSYNYTDLGSTEKAVKENLTGKALCEYNLLFGEVKQYAPQQKIILDTTVRQLAIVRIDGDRAEALVYIDQLSTRVDVNKTVAVGGQFAVQAHREGNHWKITEFDMFGQPLFNGKPAPTC
jgi:Mce-associated membrane protein